MRVSIALIAVACGAIAVRAGDSQPMGMNTLLAKVDHLVYAGPDLRIAIETIETLLGVKATPGGQHPGRGTRNAVIALTSGVGAVREPPLQYIEVIGPDPEQPPPSLPRPFGIDALTEPKLVTWAAKESDLEGRLRAAASNGVTLGALSAGSRRRPDGLLLSWTYTDPRTVVADGLAPFFINWGTTPHPAASATVGVTLVGLRAEHSDPERILKTLGALDLPMQVTLGRHTSLIATIETARGRVEFR